MVKVTGKCVTSVTCDSKQQYQGLEYGGYLIMCYRLPL